MNHKAIANSLCGRYTQFDDNSGYLESNWWLPKDGTLIGAYLTQNENGRVQISDDGDTIFNASVAGANVTTARRNRYDKLASLYGLTLDSNGVLSTACNADELPFVMAQYLQAVNAIAASSLKHRPRDEERFERLIGTILDSKFGSRVTRRPTLQGISGHQIRFPFALDLGDANESVIQTVSADNGETNWKAVYEAGGKFRDIQPARPNLRLVAVLEEAKDSNKVSRYFADSAEVIVYRGGDLPLAA